MAFDFFNQLSDADKQRFAMSIAGRFGQNLYTRPGQGKMQGFGNAMIGSMSDLASIQNQARQSKVAQKNEERAKFLMEEATRKRDKEMAFDEKIANIFKDYGMGGQPEKQPSLVRDYGTILEDRPSPLMPPPDTPTPLTGNIGELPGGMVEQMKMEAMQNVSPSQLLSTINMGERQEAITDRRATQKPLKQYSKGWFAKKDSEGSLTEQEAKAFETLYPDEFYESQYSRRREAALKSKQFEESTEDEGGIGRWLSRNLGGAWDSMMGNEPQQEVPYGSLK